MADIEGYSGWALVEQMGFRKTVGRVQEIEQYGAKMLRLDIPVFGADGKPNGEYVTRFCGGPSLYQVSPLDEQLALDYAVRQSDPRPVRPTSYQVEDKRGDAVHHDELIDEAELEFEP
jgi:hypothetical protein